MNYGVACSQNGYVGSSETSLAINKICLIHLKKKEFDSTNEQGKEVRLCERTKIRNKIIFIQKR